MSLDYCKFQCPNCKRIEEHCQGGLLFGNDNYEIFHCKKCGKIESISVIESNEQNSFSPECCGINMEKWDEKCPFCGTKMEKTIEYSDII